MIQTTDPDQFCRQNDQDLIRILHWKNIHDPDHQQDVCQAFYLRLIRLNILAKYDPARGSFDGYILSVLDNVINDMAIDNRLKYNEMEAIAPSREVYERINEFKDWLQKHGGKSTAALLEELGRRIRGDTMDGKHRLTYYRYMRKFLDS